MKHLIKLTGLLAVITLAATVLIMASCKDDQDDEPEVPVGTISVKDILGSYPLDGGTYSFTLVCNTNWIAEIKSDDNNYLTELKTTSGESTAGTKVLFKTYDAISAGEENVNGSAVICISNPKDAFKAIDVTLNFKAEAGGVKITIEGVENLYMMDGKSYSFLIKSNSPWKINILDNEDGYVTSVNPMEDDGDEEGTTVQFVTYDAITNNKYNLSGTVLLEVTSPTEEFADRYVELHLKSEELTPDVSVSGVEDSYMMNGATYSFIIKSNLPWQINVTGNEEGYITSVNPTQNEGNESGTTVEFVTYDAISNNKYNLSETVILEIISPTQDFEKLTVELKLKSEVLTPDVSVDNIAEYYILDGTQGEFTLKSNLNWSAALESGSEYITLDTVSGSANTTGASIKFTTIDDAKKSPTGQSTTAKIKIEFEAGSGVDPITVNIKLGSAAKESNCYAVKPNRLLFIPVSRANDPEILSTGASPISSGDTPTAEVMFITTSNGLTPESPVANIKVLGTGNTALLLVETGNLTGNALVAAKIGNNIVWSWHIWVVDDPGTIYDTSSSSHALSSAYDVTYEMTWMDRNLGALKPASSSWSGEVSDPTVGLYYQWGRKDPFAPYAAYDLAGNQILLSVSADEGITLSDALNNPMVSYRRWTGSNGQGSWVKGAAEKDITPNAKTVFDPCPEGWRVPEIGITTSYPGSFGPSVFGKGGEVGTGTTNSWGAFTNNGRTFYASGQFFPATGYNNISGEMTNFGKEGYYLTATRAKGSSSTYAEYSTRSLVVTDSNVRTNDGLSIFVTTNIRCVKNY